MFLSKVKLFLFRQAVENAVFRYPSHGCCVTISRHHGQIDPQTTTTFGLPKIERLPHHGEGQLQLQNYNFWLSRRLLVVGETFQLWNWICFELWVLCTYRRYYWRKNGNLLGGEESDSLSSGKKMCLQNMQLTESHFVYSWSNCSLIQNSDWAISHQKEFKIADVFQVLMRFRK